MFGVAGALTTGGTRLESDVFFSEICLSESREIDSSCSVLLAGSSDWRRAVYRFRAGPWQVTALFGYVRRLHLREVSYLHGLNGVRWAILFAMHGVHT